MVEKKEILLAYRKDLLTGALLLMAGVKAVRWEYIVVFVMELLLVERMAHLWAHYTVDLMALIAVVKLGEEMAEKSVEKMAIRCKVVSLEVLLMVQQKALCRNSKLN